MRDGFEGVEVTVNVMVFVALLPLTVNEPLDGDAMIAPESSPLVILTYHVDADGRPDSVNVTVYVTFENVIVSETGAPLTVNEPEDGGVDICLVYAAVKIPPYSLLNVI